MASLSKAALATIDRLVTTDGYVMASTPQSSEEPIGRYATLFGRDALIAALQVAPSTPRDR
jgi:hypothetical protein